VTLQWGYRERRNWILWAAAFALAGALNAAAGGPQTWGPSEYQCQAWRAKYNSLSPEQQTLLHRYGVVLTGEWVLSPDLVRECAVRLGIESFLRMAVAGQTHLMDRRFIEANRGTFFRVLKHTWPIMGYSPAVPSDGAFNYEKWGILRSAGLDGRDMAELLRASLRIEGISSGFVYLFLEQPNPRLARDLRDILRRERNPATARDRTATTQLYCLAVLYSIREFDGLDDGLLRVSADQRATDAEKIVAKRLRDLVAHRQTVSWADLEGLEVP